MHVYRGFRTQEIWFWALKECTINILGAWTHLRYILMILTSWNITIHLLVDLNRLTISVYREFRTQAIWILTLKERKMNVCGAQAHLRYNYLYLMKLYKIFEYDMQYMFTRGFRTLEIRIWPSKDHKINIWGAWDHLRYIWMIITTHASQILIVQFMRQKSLKYILNVPTRP